MPRRPFLPVILGLLASGLLALVIGCATKPSKPAAKPTATVVAPPAAPPARPAPPPGPLPPVALGIDVLEERRFDVIAGRRIGLLTHPAGVNRRGESTLDVLRRAPGVRLAALFAPEHGLDGQTSASVNFGDSRHSATGLPVYSLHGRTRKPTPAMLKGLDAVVIDLQDIGVRSYTFSSAMLCAMAACFEAGVDVVVLDRPNPLGGLKVAGPPLDADLKSYVGAFRVPYVHGLTIGELARMAKESPGVMVIPGIINVSEAVRAKGRLVVVPMRGWLRAMRWPDTGLRWIPTSPLVPDFAAAVGYAMVGLGTQASGWTSGIGREHPFRGLGFPKKKPDEIIAALRAYRIPGLAFVKRPGTGSDGKPLTGVYVEVTDWEQWNPTELSFYLHKQAAAWQTLNPFATLTTNEARTFNIHVGSHAWLAALRHEGARVPVPLFIANWTERAQVYQQQVRKYWIYP